MTEYSPRLFADDAAIAHVGERLLARTLPRAEWTHEAHLAACLWLVRERSAMDVEGDLPAIIRRYNESVGGVNDDRQGYHETLTQLYVAGCRVQLAEAQAEGLTELVNAMIAGPRGARDWPLRYYSRDRLFSVAARRALVLPDLIASDAVADRLHVRAATGNSLHQGG